MSEEKKEFEATDQIKSIEDTVEDLKKKISDVESMKINPVTTVIIGKDDELEEKHDLFKKTSFIIIFQKVLMKLEKITFLIVGRLIVCHLQLLLF